MYISIKYEPKIIKYSKELLLLVYASIVRKICQCELLYRTHQLNMLRNFVLIDCVIINLNRPRRFFTITLHGLRN